MNPPQPPARPLDAKGSLLWLVVAVACFHAAYTSLRFPAAGLLIFGYAFALVRLSDQPTGRRAFYFGLATGFASCVPQLHFFWEIFKSAAIVLWLIWAFWIGLFSLIAHQCTRRWGPQWSLWLIPVAWTGLEYFRSELYYFNFSWLNIGYALPPAMNGFGMYGSGFLALLLATSGWQMVRSPAAARHAAAIFLVILVIWNADVWHIRHPAAATVTAPTVTIAGVQMEFPIPKVLPRVLNQALARRPQAQIFVLSEYTLDGPVPDALKNWCRQNRRYLVVGGKDVITNDVYFNTAFVIGTNGAVIFKQAKIKPIQFFEDGRPALTQAVWNSPWGRIGICICYDLSFTRVTDGLVAQGAQLLVVPTMDVREWRRHQHELHSRVAPVRAAEYGIPIFRLASSGISQAVNAQGEVVAKTHYDGIAEFLSAPLQLAPQATRPLDRWLAPLCTIATGGIMVWLIVTRKCRVMCDQ